MWWGRSMRLGEHFSAATIGSVMRVWLDVGATIVPPGWSAPEASAAAIMRTAMRSFTEPPGLKYSTLASTSGAWPPASSPRVTLRSLTSGVFPISSIRESWTCIGAPYSRCKRRYPSRALFPLGDERALAYHARDQAALAELPHGPAHSLVGDSPLISQFALCWQPIAWCQVASSNPGRDVVGGLDVQRCRRVRVEDRRLSHVDHCKAALTCNNTRDAIHRYV